MGKIYCGINREEFKQLENLNPTKLKEISEKGKNILLYTSQSKTEKILEIINSTEHQNLLFWYCTKALKLSLDQCLYKSAKFLIEDLNIDINHEEFQFIVHKYIWKMKENCKMITEDSDHSLILKLLLTRINDINEMDSILYSTSLHIACKILCFPFIKILVGFINREWI